MPIEKHNTRRQRKAANGQGSEDVPLAQPDRSAPKTKTLLQLASERQDELFGKADAINAQRQEPSSGDSTSDCAISNAVLYTVTLSMVHITLDVLVYHQYAQEMYWNEILQRLVTIIPCLAVIIYVLYQPLIMRLTSLRQLLFLCFSTLAGCYLVRTSNEEAYLAVMRRAPPLGTLLLWSYIEMRLPIALASFISIGFYLWFKQYSVF